MTGNRQYRLEGAVMSGVGMVCVAFQCLVAAGAARLGAWPLEVWFIGGSVGTAGAIARQHTRRIACWRREAGER